MKTRHILVFAVLAGWLTAAPGQAIEPGDTVEDLKREMGEPVGFLDVAGSQVYLYDRGRVRVENGAVISADLISAEELVIRREREALARARQAEQLREKRLRRFKEGTEVLADRLDDPRFLEASPARRVAYWKEFRMKYPEVALPDDYDLALRERDAQIRAERSEARIRRLEERARVAELEAREAAEAAEAAALRASSYAHRRANVLNYGYPTVVYGGSTRDCTCKHSRQRTCRVHYPTNHTSTYTPFRSTSGYGYQRPISSRPFITTGRKAFVPRTRAYTTTTQTGSESGVCTDGVQVTGSVRLDL